MTISPTDTAMTISPIVFASITKNAGCGQLRTALAAGLKDRIDEPCAGCDTLLTLASRSGNTECLRLLIQQGAQVDAPCAPPRATALYLAVQEGHTKATQILLEADADVTDVVGEGLTPLAVAVHQGTAKHGECARLLIASPQQQRIGAKRLDDTDASGVNLLLKVRHTLAVPRSPVPRRACMLNRASLIATLTVHTCRATLTAGELHGPR